MRSLAIIKEKGLFAQKELKALCLVEDLGCWRNAQF